MPVRDASADTDVSFWIDSYRAEPEWLPWALSTCGLPERDAIFAARSENSPG
jgi:hypothetical protein